MIRGTEIAWNLPELVQPGMGTGVGTAGEGWTPSPLMGREAGSELALPVQVGTYLESTSKVMT